MVITKIESGPTQPFKVGVTDTVATTAVGEPPLAPVNDGILPAPEAPRPIVVLELFQPKVEPDGEELNTGTFTVC